MGGKGEGGRERKGKKKGMKHNGKLKKPRQDVRNIFKIKKNRKKF